MVMDLFPTLLGIAGAPVQPSRMAVDLLARARDRVRLSEYPAAFTGPLDLVQEEYPGFDRAPWTDRLRALYADPYKLIEHEDGSCELYDLVADPLEEVDLARTERGTSLALTRQLFDLARTLDTAKLSGADEPELSAEQTGMLEALGYIEGSKAESRPAGAATVSSWSVSDRND
jgi:arylsulfatase A-like enzyme